MDIEALVTTDYESHPPDERVAALSGFFEDPANEGVLVRNGGYHGVLSRRQLTGSHHPPDEKLGRLAWPAPRVRPTEDVREVARLMVDGDARILPVFEGQQLRGVVTADAVLAAVRPFLEDVTVADVASRDLQTASPVSTFGAALNQLREHRIAHLPVVEDGDAVGILSLYDVVPLVVREVTASQGGDAGMAGRSHGGFGAREGETDRVLDLPVRDVMVSPVRTIDLDASLATAVGEMAANDASSLVVVEGSDPVGILTTTDVLDALTWEAEGNRAVQIYGTDLLDDVSYEDVVAMVDRFDDRDHDMAVIDARIHLHEHDETRRGTPLLLARIRLHTDEGLFMASGEGYGASHALNEARDVLERRIRDHKTHGQSKKHLDEETWEKRFGWWLEG